ncbi:hypothetical protein EGW08_007393, partial [Elysia chlorotica]
MDRLKTDDPNRSRICVKEYGDGSDMNETDKLAHHTDKDEDSSDSTDYEHTCVICYDIMVRPQEVRPCGHVFCELCLWQLHASTSSMLNTRQRQGERITDLSVLCPICRGSIQFCEAKEKLDDIVRSKYPHRYMERLHFLNNHIRQLENCSPPRSNGGQYQQPRMRPNHRPNQGQNQRPPLVNKMWQIFRISGKLVIDCGKICLVSTLLIYMVTTVGLLKFFLTCVGHSGILFDREERNARNTTCFHLIQCLGIVVFVASVQQFFSLQWGQLLKRSAGVFFLTSMGYYLDGPYGRNIV